MHKITINLPLPRQGRALCERGRGDREQKSKRKAVATGNKESTPPTERVARPLPPVPPGFKPRGCKGRSPLHKITINPPLPQRGRGSGG